jgi:hypothetical protein
MKMLYCNNCKKNTGHKRAIGVGTLLGGIATFGVSLAAVPFYPLRCVICGAEDKSASPNFCPHCYWRIPRATTVCMNCGRDVSS